MWQVYSGCLFACWHWTRWPGETPLPRMKSRAKGGASVRPRGSKTTDTQSSRKATARWWSLPSLPRKCLQAASLTESRNTQQGVQRCTWGAGACSRGGLCVCAHERFRGGRGVVWLLSWACKDLDQVEGVNAEVGVSGGEGISCLAVGVFLAQLLKLRGFCIPSSQQDDCRL